MKKDCKIYNGGWYQEPEIYDKFSTYEDSDEICFGEVSKMLILFWKTTGYLSHGSLNLTQERSVTMFFIIYGIDGVGKDAVTKDFPGLVVSDSRLIMYSAGLIGSLDEKPKPEHYRAVEEFSLSRILELKETRCKEIVAKYSNVLLLDHLVICHRHASVVSYLDKALTSWQEQADGFILLRATPEEIAQRRLRDIAVKQRILDIAEIRKHNRLSLEYWQRLVDKAGLSRTNVIWNRQGELTTAIAGLQAILNSSLKGDRND